TFASRLHYGADRRLGNDGRDGGQWEQQRRSTNQKGSNCSGGHFQFSYSFRKAAHGSVRVSRTAGAAPASRAAIISTIQLTAKVVKSCAFTPYSRLDRTPLNANAKTRPAALPSRISRACCLRTSRNTPCRVAPS